jgi:hypothetical protein
MIAEFASMQEDNTSHFWICGLNSKYHLVLDICFRRQVSLEIRLNIIDGLDYNLLSRCQQNIL